MMKRHRRGKLGRRAQSGCQWNQRGAAAFVGDLSRKRFCKADGLVAERELQREEQAFARRQLRNDRLRLIFKLWRIAEWPPSRIARVLGILDEEVHGIIDVIEDLFNCLDSADVSRKEDLDAF
jgi:hypothetical protein